MPKTHRTAIPVIQAASRRLLLVLAAVVIGEVKATPSASNARFRAVEPRIRVPVTFAFQKLAVTTHRGGIVPTVRALTGPSATNIAFEITLATVRLRVVVDAGLAEANPAGTACTLLLRTDQPRTPFATHHEENEKQGWKQGPALRGGAH